MKLLLQERVPAKLIVNVFLTLAQIYSERSELLTMSSLHHLVIILLDLGPHYGSYNL